MSDAAPRVWLEVNLTALVRNYRTICRTVKPLHVMPVLKADAYGIGCGPVAAALAKAGASRFGVAEVREALPLLELDRPVHILGALLPDEAPLAVRSGLVAPIGDAEIAKELSAAAVAQATTATCHILVDSGMGRLGLPIATAFAVIQDIDRLPGLHCEGIYSHFPHAYGDPQRSRQQVREFTALLQQLAAAGIRFDHVHMANSDGVNNQPKSCHAPFTMVRTGINLYGAFDLAGERRLAIETVLTLKTRLVQVREMTAGATIGYGCTHTLARDTRVGTAAVGYADGFPIALSNRGRVIIRGVPCPVLGRVSMDYVTVDVSALPEATAGDEVECLGENIPIAEWAEARGTISYDVICSFGNRVVRTYQTDGAWGSPIRC